MISDSVGLPWLSCTERVIAGGRNRTTPALEAIPSCLHPKTARFRAPRVVYTGAVRTRTSPWGGPPARGGREDVTDPARPLVTVNRSRTGVKRCREELRGVPWGRSSPSPWASWPPPSGCRARRRRAQDLRGRPSAGHRQWLPHQPNRPPRPLPPRRPARPDRHGRRRAGPCRRPPTATGRCTRPT
jgi:hypothetical protein